MCGRYCPCESTAAQTQWTSLSTQEVEERGRDIDNDWVFGGVVYDISSQQVGSDTSFVGVKAYKRFQDCLDDSITRPDLPQSVSDAMYPFTNSDG